MPAPWPLAADVRVIQAARLAAVHAHSRSTVMLTDPSPPETPKLDAEFVAVIWQRVAVGPVVFVTPLLPQAAANRAATAVANSRGLLRVTPASIQVALQRHGAGIGEGMRYVMMVAVALGAAEVGNAALSSALPPPTCAARTDTRVHWVRAAPAREWGSLDRWCAAVGPPARIDSRRDSGTLTGSIAIVSWNDHVGAGDIDAFVSDLRGGRLTGGRRISVFVILMQEAYRSGTQVPERTDPALRWASAELPRGPRGPREDVLTAAGRLGLDVVYIPSMRNGAPGATAEDRGNAILSTLPLTDVTAVELPLERQRRVAIEATIVLRDAAGAPRPVRLVDTHFTNMVMHHLWLFSEAGRSRQAHALEQAVPRDGALVIGGDFNAWFGFHDAAYRELSPGVHPADVEDRRPTFGPLRLDHLLFRLPAGCRTSVRRADDRYGSDHHPLVATIDVVPSPG